ncbi:hypothetical protein [Serratia microhaemolytica]|uniref:hypothetical protein n=1 Tax=Serratia microhaemolytica TaxID=2675110 RepID=UPI000FDE49C0|nr:hypothetical protein [Serratia microhaemolytica]
MRWLLATLIAFFCWGELFSGQKCYATIIPWLNISHHAAENLTSPLDTPVSTPELRRKPLTHILVLLPREQSDYRLRLKSLQSASSDGTDCCIRFLSETDKQSVLKCSSEPQQIGWMLHSTAQHNRLGGWKESNMLYRASLLYLLPPVVIS